MQATFDFSLSEQAYAKATAKNIKTVNLWLGAQVMLEYELDEAKALLVRSTLCLSVSNLAEHAALAACQAGRLHTTGSSAESHVVCRAVLSSPLQQSRRGSVQDHNVDKAREQLQQLNSELDTLKDFITTSQVHPTHLRCATLAMHQGRQQSRTSCR